MYCNLDHVSITYRSNSSHLIMFFLHWKPQAIPFRMYD
jgi:hypothetical protein